MKEVRCHFKRNTANSSPGLSEQVCKQSGGGAPVESHFLETIVFKEDLLPMGAGRRPLQGVDNMAQTLNTE